MNVWEARYNGGVTSTRTLVLVVVLAGMASACARQVEGDRIAVFTKNQTNPFFQTVRQGADSAVKQMQASVIHYIPTQPDSIPEQMSQIEDASRSGRTPSVFIPVDSKAMVPGVQKMNAAGIPVVNIVDHSLGGDSSAGSGRRAHHGALDRPVSAREAEGKATSSSSKACGGSLGSTERVRGFKRRSRNFRT